jgi:multiple sugar transport system ATP-binding protein
MLGATGFRLPAPASLHERIGQTVTLGIRPEHLNEPATGEEGCDAFEAHVDIAEQLGSEVLLHVTAGQDTLLARAGARTQARAGTTVRLAVEPGRVYLFEKQTGLAIV